jgi:DNA-binding PadR family transcriptional regulator
MASRPTATSFALLGLLGVQPWTAYELVAQARRSLHYFWPRSEAHLYAELKRLVERGHAEAEVVEGRRRQRTRYTITAAGRAALKDWLGTEPAPPSLEIEGLLRVLLADQGSAKDLRAALETTARQARELRAGAVALVDELLCTGGPFPQRLHLTERAAALYGEFLLLLIRWCDETLAEVQTWPDTRDIGLTPIARERLPNYSREPAKSPNA